MGKISQRVVEAVELYNYKQTVSLEQINFP